MIIIYNYIHAYMCIYSGFAKVFIVTKDYYNHAQSIYCSILFSKVSNIITAHEHLLSLFFNVAYTRTCREK